MTLVITDLFVINYVPLQSLKNTSQMLISQSGKFHTHLKNGNRVRILNLASFLVVMTRIGKKNGHLSFFDYFHQA